MHHEVCFWPFSFQGDWLLSRSDFFFSYSTFVGSFFGFDTSPLIADKPTVKSRAQMPTAKCRQINTRKAYSRLPTASADKPTTDSAGKWTAIADKQTTPVACKFWQVTNRYLTRKVLLQSAANDGCNQQPMPMPTASPNYNNNDIQLQPTANTDIDNEYPQLQQQWQPSGNSRLTNAINK